MSKDNPFEEFEISSISKMLQVRVLTRILLRKGLITREELLAEMKVVRKEIEEKIRRMEREN